MVKQNKIIKVESLVIFKCNCHCIMCSVGKQMNRSDNLVKGFEDVKKDIDRAFKIGAREFAFSGGEPTLRKDLFDLVKYANEKRFEKIEIQSNGRIYANKYFGEKMIEAGVNSFVISLHSPKQEVNDKIMGVSGAFKEQVRGIKNLNALGRAVKINVVITRFNYKDLVEHINFLLNNFEIDEIRLTFALLEGYAGEKPKKTVAPMSLIIPYLKKAIDLTKGKSVKIFVYNIPVCLLLGYEDYVNDLGSSNTCLIGSNFETYLDESKKKDKIKSNLCSGCIYNSKCQGVWKKYSKVFGLDELKPVL
ncbi:radical SAM protein [bacterium]|nr:radical SAM protein [bacterium]